MNVRFVARKARWFIEDYSLVIVGVMAAAVLALGLLLAFTGPDEEAIREEVTVEVVTQMISSIGPTLLQAQMQIAALQAQVAELQAQTGNLAVAPIRPNEELGAYSDPGGNFYCFPVEP
jgi:hypothetical protein